jgi:hypothetical protein
MNAERLNEHDANQGAQSKGEFLGMTGNSAWYLLGAAGSSVLLVILLWGVLGFSLLVCLTAGLALCALALAYVFALKNNRPEHYDTDFFEVALIDAGVLSLAFGPRETRPTNPFRSEVMPEIADDPVPKKTRRPIAARCSRVASAAAPARDKTWAIAPLPSTSRREREEPPMVPLNDYQRLRDELRVSEDALEEALAAREEEAVCE